MNNKQRKKLQQQGFERRIVSTLSRCNQRVEKAVISPSLRDRHESTSVCLPEIAIFNAGYRKSESITAR